jgi:hypothetical protein
MFLNMSLPPDQAAAYISAIIFAVAAGYERFRSNKVVTKTATDDAVLSDAKRQEERGNLMAKMADEYRSLYSKEAEEHIKTREFWHSKQGDHQTNLSKCQEKILELQARPDLTDILTSIRAQGEVSLQILEGIREVLQHITKPE